MIRIYGLKSQLAGRKEALVQALDSCFEIGIGTPARKHAFSFIALDKEDFFVPDGRSDNFIAIEINLMQGRTEFTKKRLIKMIFSELQSKLKIDPIDVEITIEEQPMHCWGFRGLTGDEANDLTYNVHR